jgi:hypothetical protein
LSFLTRYLRRRRLLREAAALEAEARRLRRTMLDRLAQAYGAPVILGAICILCAAQYSDAAPKLKQAATVMMDAVTRPSGDEARATTLENQAQALREEAARP